MKSGIMKKKYLPLAVYVLLFLLLLFLNICTPMVADDFTYVHSFYDGKPITSILQIYPSMIGHAKGLNGRIFAHFFVQVFDFLPPICFDIINAAIFVSLVFVVYRIICSGQEKSAKQGNWLRQIVFTVMIFAAIWVFPLDFGEAFLWLAGSCNYSWGILIGLLFLLPFLNKYMYDKMLPTAFAVLFVIFSYFAGGWSENISSSAIFMAVVFLVLTKIQNKKKIEPYYYLSIISAAAGFLTMALAPAELRGKVGEFSLEMIMRQFRAALNMYKEYSILLFAFIVLLICAILDKIDLKRIILSCVFFVGSLAANFILMLAQYYSGRSSVCVAIFLIVSNGILIVSLFDRRQLLVYSCIAFVTVSCLYWGIIGSIDILNVHSQIRANETIILENKQNGNLDISIPLVRKHTKYSVGFYINTEDKTEWPNNVIAEYYGVSSVIGYEEENAEE